MTKRLTYWAVFFLPTLLAGACGWRAYMQASADLEAIAAMGAAWRVFYGQEMANMALIGFDRPPLLALLYLPFAAFAPQLLVTGLAAPLLGAFFAGLCVLILWRLSLRLQLGPFAATALCALFVVHPLVLSYAALGGRGIVLTFLFLGLAASLMSWAQEQRVRDVLTGSFFAAAALMTAYETLLPNLSAAAYLALSCRSNGDTRPAKAEGLLLAFLLPAAYAAFVWIGANWAILGDPWHFLPARPAELADIGTALGSALRIGLAAQPLLLALLYHGLRPRVGEFCVPPAVLLLAAFAAVGVFPQLRAEGIEAAAWTEHIAVATCALGVGWALLVGLIAQIGRRRGPSGPCQLLSPGLVLIAFGSVALAYWQQVTEHTFPANWAMIACGRPAFAANIRAERVAGERLRGELAPGRDHAIFGPRAFVVALTAKAKDNVCVISIAETRLASLWRDWRPGSCLLVWRPSSAEIGAWAKRYRGRRLEERWRVGDWRCFIVVDAMSHSIASPRK